MNKEIQYNKHLDFHELKPEVSESGVFFPTSLRYENLDEYHGDARSFGYHYDDGQCTVVTYERVVGALAEDTIEMFNDCSELKAAMKKPHHSHLDISDDKTACDRGNSELLIRYDSEYFYKDDKGYFFITEYYCNGQPQRVTSETAAIYRELNVEYQRAIKKYNTIMSDALNNVRLLRETLQESQQHNKG